MKKTLSDCTDLDKEQKFLIEEMETTELLIRKNIDENTLNSKTQYEYIERYEQLKEKISALETERQRRLAQKAAIQTFITTIQSQDTPPIEFDEDLWRTLIDRVTVNADETVLFRFKGGIEITEQK